MKKYFINPLLLISISVFSTNNQEKVDSLLSVLATLKADTGKVSVLIDIANTYHNFETENALKYCNQALELAEELGSESKLYECYVTKGLINSRIGNNKEAIQNFKFIIKNAGENHPSKARAYVNIGNLYADVGDYDSSLFFYEKSIIAFENIKDKTSKANVLNNIGTIYSDLGDFDKAIAYYTRSQKTSESINNKSGAAAAIGNIGIIYYYQSNIERALEYIEESVKIYKEINQLDKVANSLNNLAAMYSQIDKMDKAIECFKESSLIYEKLNHKSGMALMAQNTANMYFKIKNGSKGLEYMDKAIKLYEELDNKKDIGKCYRGLGQYYVEIKEYDLAIKNFLISEEIFTPLNVKNDLRTLYDYMAIAYEENNSHKKSNEYLHKYIAVNDSIFNSDKSQQITEMQEKFDSESKQTEIELQQIEIAKQNSEVAHQTKQKIWFGIGLGLSLVLLIMAFRGYRQKKEANSIITHQKNEVEEKNKEIIDSINYAKRIQNALLNSEEHEAKFLREHFIYFNPKDIVSGDFYWTFEKHNFLYLAVADCTGHGVPGAFLTMLGTAFLNEITAKEATLSPSEILNELRSKIIKELNQTGAEGENKDGMDMSLIRLDISTNELQWSGANNPLWLVKNKLEEESNSLKLIISINDKHLYEIKADKQPISYYPESKPFTNHKIKLDKEDVIYLFTDGYADQFGGVKVKKFKYKPFKQLLVSLSNQDLKEQRNALENNFTQWQGDLEQIDDVCVIGLRI